MAEVATSITGKDAVDHALAVIGDATERRERGSVLGRLRPQLAAAQLAISMTPPDQRPADMPDTITDRLHGLAGDHDGSIPLSELPVRLLSSNEQAQLPAARLIVSLLVDHLEGRQ